MNSACGVERTYAESILNGAEENPHYFVYICDLDEGDNPFEHPHCWPKTNPSMPWIPGQRYLEERIRTGKGMPSKRSLVMRLQFCTWQEAAEPWIDAARWIECETHDPVPEDAFTKPSVLSLDLSKAIDLASVCLVTDMGDHLLAQHWSWTPEETLEDRERRDKVPYRGWVRTGFLETCPGSVIEMEWLALRIQELIDIYNVEALCYDAWKIDEFLAAARMIRLELTKFPDRPGLLIMPHAQGFERERRKDDPEQKSQEVISLWMPKSIEETERLIHLGKLKSVYNPLVRSAVLGAVTLYDGSENRKFHKARSTRRIDPCVALVQGVGLMRGRRPEPIDVGSIIPTRRS